MVKRETHHKPEFNDADEDDDDSGLLCCGMLRLEYLTRLGDAAADCGCPAKVDLE